VTRPLQTTDSTIAVETPPNKSRGVVILLAVYAACAIFLMAVSGAAPVSDEAAYGRMAKVAAEEHHLQMSSLTEPIAMVPVGVGALVLKMAGFSFTALRFSVLIFSLFGALALYWLLKEVGLSDDSALLGALVMLAYPEFLVGSFQFMTDVPYLSLMLLALLFYVRGLARENDGLLLLGSAFSVAACMSRQPGILIPVTVAIFLLLTKRTLRPAQWFLLLILPVLADLSGLGWYYRQPGRMAQGVHNLPGIPLYLETAFYIAVYSGLLCLPLTIGMAAKVAANEETRARFAKYFFSWCAALAGVLAFISWKAGSFLPFPYPLAPVGDRYDGLVGTVFAYVVKEELPFDLPLVALKILFLLSLIAAASLLGVMSMTIANSPAFASAVRLIQPLRKRWAFVGVGAALAAACLVGLVDREQLFALVRRMYNLRHFVHSFDENLPRITRGYDSLLAQLGLTSIGLFVLQFLPRRHEEERPSPRAFAPEPEHSYEGLVYWACLGQALFVIFIRPATAPFVFRRYVLMFAPALLLFLLSKWKEFQPQKSVMIAAIGVLCVYGALWSRGSMRYADAKWEGAALLQQSGVPASEINAGLTFNNWFLNAPLDASYDSRYLVISSAYPGYRQLKDIPVPAGLSGGLHVYVLEREK
jgi:hypothetical protein